MKSNIRIIVVVALMVGISYGFLACGSMPAGLSLAPMSATGSWTWFNGGTVTISPDFTLKHEQDGAVVDKGTWKAASIDGRTIKLTWDSGFTDTMTLSLDGKTLKGENEGGATITGTR